MGVVRLRCPNCGAPVEKADDDTYRCGHCGDTNLVRVSYDGKTGQMDIWACHRCGQKNESQSKYCCACGTPLTHECPGKVRSFDLHGTKVSLSGPESCGATIRNTLRYCPRCGADIAETHEFLRKEQEKEQQDQEHEQRERAKQKQRIEQAQAAAPRFLERLHAWTHRVYGDQDPLSGFPVQMDKNTANGLFSEGKGIYEDFLSLFCPPVSLTGLGGNDALFEIDWTGPWKYQHYLTGGPRVSPGRTQLDKGKIRHIKYIGFKVFHNTKAPFDIHKTINRTTSLLQEIIESGWAASRDKNTNKKNQLAASPLSQNIGKGPNAAPMRAQIAAIIVALLIAALLIFINESFCK
jgi:ribosomal protein S27AE